METRLTFPAIYKRGVGVLNELGDFCKIYGHKAIITGGHKALETVGDAAQASLEAAGMEVVETYWYGGECTWDNVDKMAAEITRLGAECIVAAGGGRSLDTAKAAAYQLNLPIITIPTIGATCAAMTPLSIINDEHGGYIENSPKSKGPVGVFVDTAVIAKAPARWLYGGMGDTLAKMYEYRATASKAAPTSWVIGAINNGVTCYDIIKKYGKGAKEAVMAQTPNDALSYALDAIIYYAGICSIIGGESLRGAAAHCVYFGFSYIPEAHEWGHGLLVGFGNLCLLALEGYSDEEIKEEIRLAIDCGVPVTLAQIAKVNEKDLELVAEVAVRSPDMRNMPFEVTEEMVIKAIKHVDELGREVTAS